MAATRSRGVTLCTLLGWLSLGARLASADPTLAADDPDDAMLYPAAQVSDDQGVILRADICTGGNSMRLSCPAVTSPNGRPMVSVINLVKATYGYSSRQRGDSSRQRGDGNCALADGDTCIVNGVLSFYVIHCQARPYCEISGDSRWIQRCGQHSTYLTVQYRCIPRRLIHYMDEAVRTSLSTGYLLTPNYPDTYRSNHMLACTLAVQPDTRTTIALKVKDFHLEGDPDVCMFDTLVIQWQDGEDGPFSRPRVHCGEVAWETTLASSGSLVFLAFTSDFDIEERGFWIEYKGVTEDGGPAQVELACWGESHVSTTSTIYETTAAYYTSSDPSPLAAMDPTSSDPDSGPQLLGGGPNPVQPPTNIFLIFGVSCAAVVLLVLIVTISVHCARRNKSAAKPKKAQKCKGGGKQVRELPPSRPPARAPPQLNSRQGGEVPSKSMEEEDYDQLDETQMETGNAYEPLAHARDYLEVRTGPRQKLPRGGAAGFLRPGVHLPVLPPTPTSDAVYVNKAMLTPDRNAYVLPTPVSTSQGDRPYADMTANGRVLPV